MQIPEALPGNALAFTGSQQINVIDHSLVLHPGQASEIIVNLKNLTASPLNIELQIETNFPFQCHVGMEGNEIAPRKQMQAVLRFLIPEDFFENQQAIAANKQEKLEIDFHGCVNIQIDPETEREQIQKSDKFNLYIRPWSNYMELLPLLYREVDLIGRFMKIFEETYQPVINNFSVMWANLDPLTAPQKLLPFLAYWVGWEVDRKWDLDKQRRLIRHALELYRWRGTRKGLRLYLHLYTGLPLDDDIENEGNKHISITEPFGNSFILNEAELNNAVLGGGQAYHFVVRLRYDKNENVVSKELASLIIEQEKPAFCTYELYIEVES
ncbi:phage tail protein [Rivularia sp. UHCC 0363]|uniref:phage tail protein n=1 Tax=Rivularia sp. UHCC 0363 TaxID=3110244 RepID=UPI002B1FAFEF|nr:phage tail protein [Rivularia sp. UHCC 0363]MEA5597113.1 phage tail protein [Rivularia sp. UHCC 0363]